MHLRVLIAPYRYQGGRRQFAVSATSHHLISFFIMNQLTFFFISVALVVLFLVGLVAKLSSVSSDAHPNDASDHS